ncbi:hypothetical protein SAY86_026813 [Trapa natans]|uniref:Uncharacterized protein n=1 Tax=Trapa natans TaxID=22666 RepID=A0AAN7QFF6_TRANT|nr:hypothetical protein SAY86_026813 [Trapa natans]
MAPSSSNHPDREAVIRKRRNGPPFKFLVPLVYAPILPLIRISLRKNPAVRDRLFTLVLAGAFAHGFYLAKEFQGLYSALILMLSCTEQIYMTSRASEHATIKMDREEKLGTSLAAYFSLSSLLILSGINVV